MLDTPQTPQTRIAGAAALLADIRRGRRDPVAGLPEALRPADQAEAEQMQLATFKAIGAAIAGWKVGRSSSVVFAAPLPDSAVAPVQAAPIRLPSGTGMELEVALRLKDGVDAEAIAYERMPQLADIVLLFEFVNSRYAAGHAPGDFDKVADCVANGSAVHSQPLGAWSWAEVETLSMRLTVDGVEVAQHAGPHRSMPIDALIAAWRDRCIAIGHRPKAGEIVTLGSLTGLLPVPAAGGVLRGELEGRGEIVCTVAP